MMELNELKRLIATYDVFECEIEVDKEQEGYD